MDYAGKTAAALKQVDDRRKVTNEKNVSTTLDNTAHDIQEARDDNEVTMLKKTTTTTSFYFTTEPVKRIHSKEGGIVTVIYRVFHADLQYLMVSEF